MSAPKKAVRKAPREQVTLEFPDNKSLAILSGAHHKTFADLEHRLGVRLAMRGNLVAIEGAQRVRAAAVLRALYARIQAGETPAAADIEAEILFSEQEKSAPAIRTAAARHVRPRSPAQAHYMELMGHLPLVFGVGPAGTGKTFLAAAFAAHMLHERRVERLILSRPALEAGERLGFLPGDMKEKVDPYLRPLYDALFEVLGLQTTRLLEQGVIEVAPLAFMRGRTLSRAFVILDEAQNCTAAQMKMVLTRLGEDSHMVVTGDPSQSDLPGGRAEGLSEALAILDGVDGVGIVRFGERDVVRHALVTRIVGAYNANDAKRAARKEP